MNHRKDNSRRGFIVKALGAAGMLAAGNRLTASDLINIKGGYQPKYDAKGLPTAVLGKTGVTIPRIALGLGSRFCNIEKAESAYQLLNYALDNGLYYWDTAHIYENTSTGVISEERLGNVLKSRRQEVFLSTKVTSRDPDEAMRQIEKSLKRLQTDRLDMLKIHDVKAEDLDLIRSRGNLTDILLRLKKEGVTRFIGFSGHSEAFAMKSMAESGLFDSMLMALNHWAGNTEKRQENAIPAAKTQGMGVMVMKVVRPRETVKELNPSDLVRYALSLKGPDGIVLGIDSIEVLKTNLEILRNFKPMNETEMNAFALRMQSFFHSAALPWTQAGYHDGRWV